MKRNILIIACFLIFTSTSKAQILESKTEISKELSFEIAKVRNSLSIKNFTGYIKIEGYDGNTVKLDVQKIIRANNSNDLKKGEEEVGINIVEDKTGITIYPKTPFIRLDSNGLIYDHETKVDEFKYDFVLNFTLKVPKKINLELANGSEGNIVVENINSSTIKASNMDGDIILGNILGQTDVETMDGDIFVKYVENPEFPSRYFSSNGSINVAFQDNLSALIKFMSTEGKIYSDFEIENKIIEKNTVTDNDGSINATMVTHVPVLTIGKGGITHEFQTFQGDVTIEKR